MPLMTTTSTIGNLRKKRGGSSDRFRRSQANARRRQRREILARPDGRACLAEAKRTVMEIVLTVIASRPDPCGEQRPL